MDKDMEIFYQGLEKIIPSEEYGLQKTYLEEYTFNRIFLESRKGTIGWTRLNEYSFIGKVSSQNYSGKLVGVPIFLDITIESDLGVRSAYLTLLKAKNGPCRNDADERVKKLLKELNISLK